MIKNTENTTQLPRYISRNQLMDITGLSSPTLWRLVQRGDLPRPVQLTTGRVAWSEDVIRAWLESRANA